MQDIKYYFNNIDGNIEIKKCTNSIHSSKCHFHNEVSLALVESGSSIVEINDKIYRISGNTLLIIPPNAVHSCNPESFDEWKFKMLYINKEWFESVFKGLGNRIKFSYIKVSGSLLNDITDFLNRIEKDKFDIELESKLLYYISLLTEITDESIEELPADAYTEGIEKVKAFLDENYLNNISLDEMSKLSGVSKYHLIRQFSSLNALSPHQYLTNLRINHAKVLLRNSKSLTDVGLQSGFYDQSHFIKSFREYTGVTPRKYKSQK